MKFYRILVIQVLIMTTILLSPIPTAACSCAEPNTVQQELERSSTVFRGEVLEIKNSSSTRKVLFEVKESWKGTTQSQVIIITGLGGGDCGFEFNIGSEYLVYATGEHSFSTNICDRTASIQSVKVSEDFEELGQGVTPRTIVDLSNDMNPFSVAVMLWVGVGVINLILTIIISKKWRKSF